MAQITELTAHRAGGTGAILPTGPIPSRVPQPWTGRTDEAGAAPAGEDASADAIVRFFLPMLDDLELVTDLAPLSIRHHPWVDALRLIRRRMSEGLGELGVSRFGDASDAFDPEVHQVVWYEAVPGLDEVRIEAVIRQGYALDGRTLRAAQVAVVGPPPAAG